MSIKNFKVTFIYLCFLILARCSNEINCNLLKYDGNVTTLNGTLYSGNCISYHNENTVASIKNYLEGKDHGEWQFFFLNGNIRTKGKFNNGKRIGLWLYYYENGQLWKSYEYDNAGKPKGEWKTYTKDGYLEKIKKN